MSHAPSHCGNCESLLTGPFCAQCGQNAHESARSVGALWHDGWHSLTHLDGRLWRTLWLLLVKPGEVSRQFVANRRASFMPPFRLYLVISLLFFGLLGITHHDDVLDISSDASDRARVCESLQTNVAWMADRLHATCYKIMADGGNSLRNVFLASLPRAMFLFLPLIAAGMLLLYWRPRRFYVEHLVFFLHNHSAAFGMACLVMLLQLGSRAMPALQAVVSLIELPLLIWLVAYLYFAMRRFYGQGRVRTLVKLGVIGVFYALSLVLLITFTALFSAMSL
jgi:Protein of unknown function (DUF3667)